MTTTRFRSGLVQLVRCRVQAETVIEPGDLLYLSGGSVRPAADFPWTTDLATTRAAFAAQFVGVAHTGSADGETDDVSVDVSPLAVYEAEASEQSYEVGDLLAPAETVAALSSRQLERVANAGHAIARSVEITPSLSPTVRACFASAYHAGSANVNAAVG
ncbi:MAG TPA: hypothetical protein VF170_04140 [Planctomycetaceae bacterium]